MIKNLLFDLGGVIMDIRRENCVKAFEALGMSDANDLLGEYSQAGVFAGIENGQLTVGEFHDEIRRIIGRPELTDEEIDGAFQKFLIGIPAHRLEELDRLHRQFSIYMLSNTNPIMWDRYILKAFPGGLDNYFDGIVTSFEAGVCKPDAKIYDYAIKKLGLNPEETTFFDDGPANIAAAEKSGFKTRLIQGDDTMLKLTENA